MARYLMFVRHGETVGNQEQIAHGRSESPLNSRGREQAQKTAEMLTNWRNEYHRVYTSPLSRAFDTGKFISDALGLPIHVFEDLKEGFLGDWEGVTYRQLDEFQFARRSMKDDDFRGHNGESPNQLSRRMIGAITEIRDRHEDENIIIVSHGAAISHALSKLLGTTPIFGYQYLMHNSAVTELIFSPDAAVEHLNLFDHLPEHLKVDPTRADQKIGK